MNQNEMFKNALWLCREANEQNKSKFYFLRSKFNIQNVKKAKLRILGLGCFHCFINGIRVSDDLFLPLNTDFEKRENYPPNEIITGHRIYVPEFDITNLLRNGDNIITIHFGGGWYTYDEKVKFGNAKTIYYIFGEDANGNFEFVSSENDSIGESFVTDYNMTKNETHDYTSENTMATEYDFDDSAFTRAIKAQEPETEYMFCDCPADRVCETILPIKLFTSDNGSIYDAGKNTTGYPVIKLLGRKGDIVEIDFSEELDENGNINAKFSHGQSTKFICSGEEMIVKPLFTWFGFRYFKVTGPCEVCHVEVIHTDIKVTASFSSDNELLNWIHNAYLNTQLSNMHTGIPSDCPHIERRGYTGDGQLVCHAAMNMLDCKSFYRKWIEDIIDCQDKISGHIQYTAPYFHSGGGPGGWGCAIVEVPYQYYVHYGDAAVLERCYPSMLKYFEYLDTHSYGNLVVRDKEGQWCLGDWCPPMQVVLPAPFVNNYFYIKSLTRCIEIAKIIGREEDVANFEKKILCLKEAVTAAYYNSWDGNFIGNLQGANAFAVDIGLGDERTYKNLVNYYEKEKRFDTGIFGTDIVSRVLFERGDGALAAKLLLSDDVHSFSEMKKRGATTIWEYWPESLRNRSHNHPMFGAVVAYFYDYFLGIRQVEKSVGYEKIIIAPTIIDEINTLNGHRRLPKGKVAVSYTKHNGEILFEIEIPINQEAFFTYNGERHKLSDGKNTYTYSL